MKYEMTIPDVPPSLNKTLRMHWAARAKLAEVWAYWIRANSPSTFFHPIYGTKMSVKVTLWHSRFYDKDNAYGACKVLVDALKLHKLIFDDNAKHLELTVEQQKCPRKHIRTVVVLETL